MAVSRRSAKRRAINLFVESELLDEAKQLGINVSETLEQRLRLVVSTERERRWREDNREALVSINSFIDVHGLLSSRLRFRPDKE